MLNYFNQPQSFGGFMKIKTTLFITFVILTNVFVLSAQTAKKHSKDCKHKPDSLTFEEKVVKEINTARTQPKIYGQKIEAQKQYLSGKIMSVPGQTRFLTFEGVTSMNLAINDLGITTPLEPLKVSKGLAKAAKQQLIDLQENAALGHTGKDGSSFGKRLAKFGDTGLAGENITYRDKTPEQVVLRMVIDDGVESRTHRKNILNAAYKKIGIACGEGKDSHFICVAIFAARFATKSVEKPKSY